MAHPLYFATSNAYKFDEMARLFGVWDIELCRIDCHVEELQRFEMADVVHDKAIKAYQQFQTPLFVDHSGLSLTSLGGFPGALNKEFWNVLGSRICTIAETLGRDAEILVTLGICDGKHVIPISHADPGLIAPAPAGEGAFNLDRVFIPKGFDITLAQMTPEERDQVSYRRKVVEKTVQILKKNSMARGLGLK